MIATGVINAAATLDVAVRETDNAVLPRAKSTKRFETLPPGQQAIRIIPSAIVGLGSNKKQMSKVTMGKASN